MVIIFITTLHYTHYAHTQLLTGYHVYYCGQNKTLWILVCTNVILNYNMTLYMVYSRWIQCTRRQYLSGKQARRPGASQCYYNMAETVSVAVQGRRRPFLLVAQGRHREFRHDFHVYIRSALAGNERISYSTYLFFYFHYFSFIPSIFSPFNVNATPPKISARRDRI